MLEYFDSLPKAIYTLYLSIVGGIDWADAAHPLMELSIFLGLLFCAYIAFAVLCVLNIITGVFVENANRITAQDAEMVMMEQMEQRQAWYEEVKELFDAADRDKTGYLDKHEFSKKMEDLKMQAWFRKIGVHVESYSANGLFKLLDFDGDGKLDMDEFAMALQQVHGHARSIDVARVSREVKLIRKELKDLGANCGHIFHDLSHYISSTKKMTQENSKISQQKPEGASFGAHRLAQEDSWACPPQPEVVRKTFSIPRSVPRGVERVSSVGSMVILEDVEEEEA
jgi:hypothetical protein